MESIFISLLAIAIASFICPVLASLIPNKMIPETVFLLIAGMVLGPHVLGVIEGSEAISLLSDLGLGLLFLLAGYEIDPKDLSGKGGRHGLLTWFVSFLIAIGVAMSIAIPRGNILGGIAVAIALTTTAYGTLVPILEERGLTSSPIGKGVIEYGSWGELGPVIAIALLLTTRATWITSLILVGFAVIAIVFAVFAKRLEESDARLARFISRNAETNSQMPLRGVMMLLIGLVALSALFGLDIVLGSFAAGFVLRAIIPKGNQSLEHKLSGIGYGFFIPLFFLVSGTSIDPLGVVDEPGILALFIVILLVIRAVPIYISLSLRKDPSTQSARVRASIALYCTTALPLVVAVSTIAVSSGAFSQETGSVLIAAGGITVFLMPMLASIILRTIDADLDIAAKRIKEDPKDALTVLKRHHRLERERSAQRKYEAKRKKVKARRKG